MSTSTLVRPRDAAARPRRRGVETLVVVLLCSATLLIILGGLVKAPMDYDEAYNLQVPRHLAATGAYATDGAVHGGGTEPFDVFISTGPTVLLPIGALFAITGPHLWVARLIPTLGYVLLLLGGWRLGSRSAGMLGGTAAVAAMLGVDAVADWPFSAVLGTGSVLGEYTAAACVLWASLQLRHRPRWAGILLGLAVMTKLVTGLAGVGFVVAMLICRRRTGLRSAADAIVSVLAGMALPVLLWQLVVLGSLGWSGYLAHVRAFSDFFARSGSGIEGVRSADVPTRLHYLGEAALGSGWLLLASLLATLVALVVRARRAGAPARGGHRDAGAPARGGHRDADMTEPLLALVLTCAGTFAWWILVAQQAWIRHVMPVVMLSVAVLAILAVQGLTRAWRSLPAGSRWLAPAAGALMAACLAAGVIGHCVASLHPPGPSLASQERAATALRRLDRAPTHILWSQNPELMFLSDRVSTPLDRQARLLVLPDLDRVISPASYEAGQARCATRLRHADGYLFCVTAASSR